MSIISVNDLYKEYNVIKKEEGIKGSFKSLFAPKKEKVVALDHVSFDIEQGETVGYIGPNGAGKSTTIKCLIGILQPSSGDIRIAGYLPQKDRIEIAKKIGVVFGQRSNLIWDIRLSESFELNKRIYQIDDSTYKKNYEEIIELLDIEKFIKTPVRQLSLGQRMRGEIAVSLLHNPSILFLDEPTIGLDFESRNRILEYINYINEKRKCTVILTSHNMDDIQKVCNRVIIINKGKVVEDGSISAISEKISPYKRIKIQFAEDAENIKVDHPSCEIEKISGNEVTYRCNKKEQNIKDVMKYFVNNFDIKDFEVQDSDIESVIREVYRNSSK